MKSVKLYAVFFILISLLFTGYKLNAVKDAYQQVTAAPGEYKVVEVLDGDTIRVNTGIETQKVRLIGIDAPEIEHPGEPAECFGDEAMNRLTELLQNKTVRLEADESQGNADKYDRLLRYVFVDETNINQQLLAEGYAYEFTYNTPYNYQSAFQNSERIAKEEQQGLWAEDTCDG